MILRILDNDTHSRAKKIPKTFFVQLYLTDSCHYLLPIGRFEKGSWAEQSKLRKAVMQYFNEVLRTSVGHHKHLKDDRRSSKSMDAGSLTLMALPSGHEGESGPDQVSDSDMEITTGSDRVNLARQLAVPVEPPAMPSTPTSAPAPTRSILKDTKKITAPTEAVP